MTVKRITVDIQTQDVALLAAFYETLFELRPVMDMGWVSTLANGDAAPIQVTLAQEGGSGAPVPDLSIEVEDVDAVHAKAVALGHVIEYALTDEPWQVRRFFLRDPAGKLINVLSHVG